MSLGDLYRKNRISLQRKLRPDRFRRSDHLLNQITEDWPTDLQYLRLLHRSTEDLQLEHTGLSSEMISQADLIVFIEEQAVKFLKHLPGIQSKESLEILLDLITQKEPDQGAWKWSLKKPAPRGRAKRREP